MDTSREDLISGQQANAASFGVKFKVIRFYLDNKRTRGTHGVTDHTFGSGIKSFWVCDTNNRGFEAKIVPNFKSDRNIDSGLPLRFNMNQKFSFPVDDACLEFEPQSGVWVDIAFSESEDISIGNTETSISGAVAVNEGDTLDCAKMTGSTTVAELLPADSGRIKATFQHKSGGSIFVGTLAACNDADYLNLCTEWPAGSNIEVWSKAAHYYRTQTGSSVFQRTVYSE